MKANVTISALMCGVLAGCATPKVTYGEFTQAAPRTVLGAHSDTYMLARTKLVLGHEMAGEGKEFDQFRVDLVNFEDPNRSFIISPKKRFGVTTNLSIQKMENTQLVKSVTVSVDDKRKEYVQQAFKLLTTVASMTGAFAPDDREEGEEESELPKRPKFPLVIDTLTYLESAKCSDRKLACNADVLVMSNDNINASLSVSPVPPDAIDVSTLSLTEASNVFLVSACRHATLRVGLHDLFDELDDLVADFAVSDPRYVQVIGLPTKGSITAHSECGYSVLPEEVELQSDADVANTTLEELAKFLAAQEDAKKNAEEGGDK